MAPTRGLVCLILPTLILLISGHAAELTKLEYTVLQQGSRFFDDFAEDTVSMASVKVALHSEAEERVFLESYPRQPYWTNTDGPYFSEFPSADYESVTVVVIALGTRGSGSIWVGIDSVVVDTGKVTVFGVENRPCFLTCEMANPSIIISIPGNHQEVAFAPIREIQEECN